MTVLVEWEDEDGFLLAQFFVTDQQRLSIKPFNEKKERE